MGQKTTSCTAKARKNKPVQLERYEGYELIQ